MKEKLFLLLLLLCGILVSCDKNTGLDGENPESGIDSKLEKEGEENSESNDDGDEEFILGGPVPFEAGLVKDGGDIQKISFCCFINKPGDGNWIMDSVKTLEDYSLMLLRLEVMWYSYRNADRHESCRIDSIATDYILEKTKFIYEDYKKYYEMELWGLPYLFTAYVNGKVTITCDKVLFGKEAGEDLSEHFRIKPVDLDFMPVGIESPYLLYNFYDDLPKYMNEFFVEESWINDVYYLDMPVAPEEKYDELTFHLTMPIKKESVRRSIAQGANGVDKPMQMIDEVYESDCLIKFNW